MREPLIVVAIVFVLGIGVLAVWWLVASTPAERRDDDVVLEAYFAEIGTETAAEEVHVRRLRISDLWRQRAARIGRRPRP